MQNGSFLPAFGLRPEWGMRLAPAFFSFRNPHSEIRNLFVGVFGFRCFD